MEGFYPLSRRRLLAGAGGLALGLGSLGARADDSAPLKLGRSDEVSHLVGPSLIAGRR